MVVRQISLWLMFLAALLTGCQPKTVGEGPFIKKINAPEFSRLVLNFSAKLKRDRALDLEDSWIGYDDYIQKACLRYSSQRLLTVKEARLLIVELVEELLYRLNNHTILSFELEKYPFTPDDIDVRINFESFYGRFVDPLYVGLVWLQCGCVHFYAFDRKDQGIDWSHDRFEPYFKSRELALIEKEIDFPYVQKDDNPPLKPVIEGDDNAPRTPKSGEDYIYDRYTPIGP